MKIKKFSRLILSKYIKVKLDRRVCESILANNKFMSKKDLGSFVSELLASQKNLDSSIHEFISRKYSLDDIANLLRGTRRKSIPFMEIRRTLNISKRKFYLRLKIIKKYFEYVRGLKWSVRRGRFVRLE